MVVGTPEYLSPEQAYGRPADARSDVYSVGIMAWRMLVGRAPFTAASPDELIRKQAREPVPSITTVRPDLGVPPELVAVVARACAKSPDDRPQSAAELAEELATALGRAIPLPTPMPRPSFRPPPEGNPARAPAPPPSDLPGPPPDRSRRLWIVAVLALGLALAVVGGAIALHGRVVTTGNPTEGAPAR